MKKLEVQNFKDNLYILEGEGVREFLITDSDNNKALLIDTGFPDDDVMEAIVSITNLPVQVILTHGDRDHCGNLDYFEEAWVHEKDWDLIRKNGHDKTRLHPIHEGEVYSCGGWDLEVIEIPGHSYGSCAFLDRKKKILIVGDTVQNAGPIFMFGPHRNLDLYIQSLEKLNHMKDEFDTILASHHDIPVNPVWIERNLEDARALKEGKLPKSPHPFMPCSIAAGSFTQFSAEPEQ